MTELFAGLSTIQMRLATGNAIAGTPAQALALLGLPLFPVKNYGAVGDGVTDDAAKIQLAIDAAEAAGGGRVVFEALNYVIKSGLIMDESHVSLVGVGSYSSHDGGPAIAGTRFTAGGGLTGGTMLKISPPSDAAGSRLDSVNVLQIAFLGSGNAANGVIIDSIKNSTIDIFVSETTAEGFKFGVVALLGESRDPQYNTIRYASRHITSTGTALSLTGDATNNTSFNTFERVAIIHKDGIAIDIENGDNNVFINTQINRAAGGTGAGVEFRAGSLNGAATGSTNLFINLASSAGAINARGTTSGTYPSVNNRITYLDKGNLTPDPTIEAGASCYWHPSTNNLTAIQERDASGASYGAGPTDVAWDTEVFDVGSEFVSPSFTAPRAAKYRISLILTHTAAVVLGDRWLISLNTSNRNYVSTYVVDTVDINSISFSFLADMDLDDTAKIRIQRAAGTGNFPLSADGDQNIFCIEEARQ